MTISFILMSLLVAKLGSDLLAVFRIHHVVDMVFGLVFLIAGVGFLAADPRDSFGYLFVAMSLVWGGRGLLVVRARGSAA